MRVGVHTGRPQRIGSDWLGVDVNIAARVMERATRGGVLIVSQATMDRLPERTSTRLACTPNGYAGQCFRIKQDGVPPDITMYRVKTRRGVASATMRRTKTQHEA